MVETILTREECSQIDLAARAGITPGFQTFNILKMMASDPKAFQISDPSTGLLEELTSSTKDNYEEMLQKLAPSNFSPLTQFKPHPIKTTADPSIAVQTSFPALFYSDENNPSPISQE